MSAGLSTRTPSRNTSTPGSTAASRPVPASSMLGVSAIATALFFGNLDNLDRNHAVAISVNGPVAPYTRGGTRIGVHPTPRLSRCLGPAAVRVSRC